MMEPFTKVTAVAAPLDMPNVDTDQIVPARFLRVPRGPEYGNFLFHDVRFDDAGKEKPEFVLNREPYRRAQILVADRNFGCGSSREGAVWALAFGGYRSVIASSFGDIFYSNALKNGFLPVQLDQGTVVELRSQLTASPGATVTVDLEAQHVMAPDGTVHPFTVHPFRRECLLRGLDDIDFTLEYQEEIDAFERDHAHRMIWLQPARSS